MTPTNPDDARYTLTELADLAGVTPRTVRFYLAQGLLPTIGASGPGAKYDDRHLARLRLIKRLQREHQPLAEIRQRLDPLDDDEIRGLVDATPAPPEDSAIDYIRRVTGRPAPAGPPAPVARLRQMRVADGSGPYEPPIVAPAAAAMPARDLPTEVSPQPQRSQWERIGLAPDVELHLRRPLTRSTAKRVDRLIEIARDLLQEDPS